MNNTTTKPKRSIDPDRRARLREAYDRRAAELRKWKDAPLLKVDGWIIFRLDPLNFCLQRVGANTESRLYFSAFADAVKRLLREKIHDELRPGLQSILDAVDLADSHVVAALQELGDLPCFSLENSGPTLK